MKVRDVVKLLESDRWILVRQRGSHRLTSIPRSRWLSRFLVIRM